MKKRGAAKLLRKPRAIFREEINRGIHGNRRKANWEEVCFSAYSPYSAVNPSCLSVAALPRCAHRVSAA